MAKKKPSPTSPGPVDAPDEATPPASPAATVSASPGPGRQQRARHRRLGPARHRRRRRLPLRTPPEASWTTVRTSTTREPSVLQRRPAIEYQSVPKNDLFLVKAFAATPV